MSRRTPDDAPVQEATVSNSDSRPLGLSSVGNAGGQGATESGQHRGASWCFISSKAEDCDQSEDDDQSEEDNQSEEDARPEYVDLVKLASGMKISNQDKHARLEANAEVPAWTGGGGRLSAPLCELHVLRAMQVAHDVLPEQQLWSAKSPPLARDALHDFLRKATAVAPILPGTIVFLRARTDGTWGDGCDKARPGRGGGSRRSSGGSGSRSTRSTQANRFRWGLVTEPPVSVSPSHTPDGSIANTMMRGVGEGVGMTTDSSALPPAGIKGAAAMAEVVWIANPSGEFEAPFSIDRWRVVNRDFQEDAMQALSEAAGDPEAALATLSSSKFRAGLRTRLKDVDDLWTHQQVEEAITSCYWVRSYGRHGTLGDKKRDEKRYGLKSKSFRQVVDFSTRYRESSWFGRPIKQAAFIVLPDGAKRQRANINYSDTRRKRPRGDTYPTTQGGQAALGQQQVARSGRKPPCEHPEVGGARVWTGGRRDPTDCISNGGGGGVNIHNNRLSHNRSNDTEEGIRTQLVRRDDGGVANPLETVQEPVDMDLDEDDEEEDEEEDDQEEEEEDDEDDQDEEEHDEHDDDDDSEEEEEDEVMSTMDGSDSEWVHVKCDSSKCVAASRSRTVKTPSAIAAFAESNDASQTGNESTNGYDDHNNIDGNALVAGNINNGNDNTVGTRHNGGSTAADFTPHSREIIDICSTDDDEDSDLTMSMHEGEKGGEELDEHAVPKAAIKREPINQVGEAKGNGFLGAGTSAVDSSGSAQDFDAVEEPGKLQDAISGRQAVNKLLLDERMKRTESDSTHEHGMVPSLGVRRPEGYESGNDVDGGRRGSREADAVGWQNNRALGVQETRTADRREENLEARTAGIVGQNIQDSTANGEGAESSTKEGMRNFMNRLQVVMPDHNFRCFVDVLKRYRGKELSLLQLVASSADCLRPLKNTHPELVAAFNSYLPPGVEVEL